MCELANLSELSYISDWTDDSDWTGDSSCDEFYEIDPLFPFNESSGPFDYGCYTLDISNDEIYNDDIVCKYLSEKEIDKLFNLENILKNINKIYKRIKL